MNVVSWILVGVYILALAGILLAWAGKLGKEKPRIRALPPGTERMRSREEILFELGQGKVYADRAIRAVEEAEARLAGWKQALQEETKAVRLDLGAAQRRLGAVEREVADVA